jgi:hypothetical protein
VPLYSNYAFRRLNVCVSVFPFYESTTDPIFPPLNLFEFSLQFGCGSQLKLRDNFVYVEIDAHEGDLRHEIAGVMLQSDCTTARVDQRGINARQMNGSGSFPEIRLEDMWSSQSRGTAPRMQGG